MGMKITRNCATRHIERYAAHEVAVTDLARCFLANHGLDLVESCQRHRGARGAGLAWAFIDMVRSQDCCPSTWPIAEIIRVLECNAAAGDILVLNRIRNLRRIQREVKRLGVLRWLADDPDEVEEGTAA